MTSSIDTSPPSPCPSLTVTLAGRIAAASLLLSASAGCSRDRPDLDISKAPLGLPPVPVPQGDPYTIAKAELGRQLFYDRRLGDPEMSCADCHKPEHGFAGIDATQGFHRNVPTAFNRAYGRFEFWDGSAGTTLEELIYGVLRFINRSGSDPYWERLQAIPSYRKQFQAVFGRPPDEGGVIQAIATFSRTLLAGDSPYDRFKAGDRKAMTPAAQRGLILFSGKAGCAACHTGPNFTDEEFHNIGMGQDETTKRFYPATPGKPNFPELGRYNLTKVEADRGAFKTPTLRELTQTDPYMHAGQLETLEDVVAYYDRGGLGVPTQDPRIHPLGLTGPEKTALVAFLRALSSGRAPPPPPELPN
jgi:cytochrome c peroxidase